MATEHHGFKIWYLLDNPYLNEHPQVACGAICATLIVAGAVAYRASAPALSPTTENDRDFVPNARLGIRNIFELTGEFVQTNAKNIIGPHYKPYLPLLVFIFMWTLVNNCMGLVPTIGASTDDLNTTLAMGAVVFFYYNFVGFKVNGTHYLENFTGHLPKSMFLLWLIMIPIEVISHVIRPITLGIRLRANINGDHMIYGIFSGLFADLYNALSTHFGVVGKVLGGLLYAAVPLPIVVLGLLICIIQAFVFMLLTTIYIGMATAHEEKH